MELPNAKAGPQRDHRRFTSDRERRLWWLVVLAVATIYGTLGLAGTLAGILGDRGLNAATFVLGGLLIVAAVATQGLERRIGRWEVFVALGLGAVLVLAFTRLTTAVERSHLMEYGVVAILIYRALQEGASNGRRVPRPAWTAVGATALIGLIDEVVQAPLPNRVFDPVDIGFNIAAAVLAVSIGAILDWSRERQVRSSRS